MTITTHARTVRAGLAAAALICTTMTVAACGDDATIAPSDIGAQVPPQPTSSPNTGPQQCMRSPKYDKWPCHHGVPHSYGDDQRWRNR